MNTVHTLSQILCIVLRWAGSCPEYVTDCAKSTVCRVTSAVTHIHLAIGGAIVTLRILVSGPGQAAQDAHPQFGASGLGAPIKHELH